MPADLAAFLAQPFSSNMSAARWFLFIGLLLVVLWAWHMIYAEWTNVEPTI
jgi:hypothetical protein